MTKHVSDIALENATTPALANSGDDPSARKPTEAHADAISQLFTELELAYHNQFHKAYSDSRTLAMAKQLWLKMLASFEPAAIVAAGRSAIADSEYLPTLHTLQKHCAALHSATLPPVRAAFVEACMAEPPYSNASWSHAIVYHCGKETGWQFLRGEIEAKTFPVFERNYAVLLARLQRGETLQTPLPQALPEPGTATLSEEQQREQLARLKKELAL